MISLIVAYSKNRVIGNNGIIPWKIKGEQKRFKELTTGNIVVMGRHSYEEIGRPLPNRMTYLVSSTMMIDEENCKTVTSLEEALSMANGKDIYISGGAMLYMEALPLVDRMYITIIEKEIDGDTYFPNFDEDLFNIIYEETFVGDIPYRYLTYERKSH
ncbi:MAG TPA: dihydrofolate reductase [Lachnospiraceae bacterium]|nr:dihydrofolate reductase [Lachnospiraceae bacterium]HEX3076177.1 dihydrofolate reductase [Lachnospiraceae bacterium]